MKHLIQSLDLELYQEHAVIALVARPSSRQKCLKSSYQQVMEDPRPSLLNRLTEEKFHRRYWHMDETESATYQLEPPKIYVQDIQGAMKHLGENGLEVRPQELTCLQTHPAPLTREPPTVTVLRVARLPEYPEGALPPAPHLENHYLHLIQIENEDEEESPVTQGNGAMRQRVFHVGVVHQSPERDPPVSRRLDFRRERITAARASSTEGVGTPTLPLLSMGMCTSTPKKGRPCISESATLHELSLCSNSVTSVMEPQEDTKNTPTSVRPRQSCRTLRI